MYLIILLLITFVLSFLLYQYWWATFAAYFIFLFFSALLFSAVVMCVVIRFDSLTFVAKFCKEKEVIYKSKYNCFESVAVNNKVVDLNHSLSEIKFYAKNNWTSWFYPSSVIDVEPILFEMPLLYGPTSPPELLFDSIFVQPGKSGPSLKGRNALRFDGIIKDKEPDYSILYPTDTTNAFPWMGPFDINKDTALLIPKGDTSWFFFLQTTDTLIMKIDSTTKKWNNE